MYQWFPQIKDGVCGQKGGRYGSIRGTYVSCGDRTVWYLDQPTHMKKYV